MKINAASIIAVAAVCATSLLPVAVQAAPYMGQGIRAQIDQEQVQVRQAVRAGQVNPVEGHRLSRRVQEIKRQAVADRQYGRLSAQERLQIQAELDRVSLELGQSEHNFSR